MTPSFYYRGFDVISGIELDSTDFISIDSISGEINLSSKKNSRSGIFNIKIVGLLPNGVD
jgi:hypothetical protein